MPTLAKLCIREFDFERSAIASLLGRSEVPLLGQLAYHIKTVVWAHPRGCPHSETIWSSLDFHLGGRRDYRVWRRWVMRMYPSECSNGWSPVADALTSIAHDEPEVAWGTLAVISGWLSTSNPEETAEQLRQRREIARAVQDSWGGNRQPIPYCQASCGLIHALGASAVQQALFNQGERFSISEANNYIDQFSQGIQAADANWTPGAIPYVGPMLEVEFIRQRSATLWQGAGLQIRLGRALHSLRAIGRRADSAHGGPHDIQEVLDRCSLLAISAWRLLRASRIGVERAKARPHGGAWARRYRVGELKEAENEALRGVAKGRWEAGDNLGAAVANWLLVSRSTDHVPVAKVCKIIGNAGLVAPNVCAGPPQATVPRASPVGARCARWAQMRAADSRWGELGLPSGVEPNQFLWTMVEHRNALALSQLEAAFGLCADLGWLRLASDLAGSVGFDRGRLLALARAIARAQRVNPLALDHELMAGLRGQVLVAWSGMFSSVGWTADERRLLHHVVGPRMPGLLVGSADLHRLLATHLYDGGERADVPDSPMLLAPNVEAQSIASLQSELPAGMASLSVMIVGMGMLSVLAIGKQRVEHASLVQDGIESASALVRAFSNIWLIEGRLAVPWPAVLCSLARLISVAARRVTPGCRWVRLAVDHQLAQIPWNALLRDCGVQDLTIALSPGLSWSSSIWPRPKALSGYEAECSSDPALVDFAQILNKQSARSWAVVLGHGEEAEAGLPVVAGAHGTITAPRWLRLCSHRVMVVHACHSGQRIHASGGDLGGLPGLALFLGCRALLAPISEVPIESARRLNSELFASAEGTLGERYRAAIAAQPTVALYNFYGFPDEPA